jgi:hypothetical protein
VNQRLAAIEAKRARLIERAARERAEAADVLILWSQPLDFLDRCLAGAKFFIARPPLVAAAAIALLLLRPRRAWKWTRRAFALWQGYRWLKKKIAV